MKSMFAFLAGVFLVIVGYSLGNRAANASNVADKGSQAEQKLSAMSQFLSPLAMLLGGILVAASLFFVFKKGRQGGGRYD